VQAGDNLNKVRCGLRTEINNDADLAEIGVHATCGGGVLDLTSTSTKPTSFWESKLIECKPVLPIAAMWPAAEKVKYCGDGALIANATRVRSTLEHIGDNSGGENIAYASDKLKSDGQFTVYVYHNHNDFYESWDNYPWRKTNGPTLGQVFAVSLSWNSQPRNLLLGWSTANELSLIFENAEDRNDPGRTVPETDYAVNHSIRHSAAHEMGHQFSFLAGNMANNADFQQAWQFDLDGMGLATSCKRNAHAANTEPPQPLVYDGIFTGSLAADGSFVCGAGGQGFGGVVPTVMLGTKYPYFSQFSNRPIEELPRVELFSDYFAYRAGFPDYIASDGSQRAGSNQAFDTSGALLCTSVYMIEQFRFGQNPITGDFGYPFPASDTETGVLRCSDGAITVTDNPGT
jgi:hypothetical protein